MHEEYETILRIAKSRGQYINETLLANAFDFAVQKHAGQTRKSGEPYILHPIAVTKILADLGFETNVLCAALLHDVVEDCDVSCEDLKNRFNEEISDLVDAVSAIKHDGDALKLSKNELDTMDMKKFVEHAQSNKKAYYIKLADRLHNLRTLDPFKPEKRLAKIKETRRLLLPIASNLEAYFFVLKMEDLCFKYENPDVHKILFSNYEREMRTNAEQIRTMRTYLKDLVSGNYNDKLNSKVDQIFTHIYEYKRRIFDIYRQATPDISNINDLHIDFHAQQIPLKNFILRVSEDFMGNPVRLLRTFYNYCLEEKGYIWLEEKLDSHKLRRYVLLQDPFKNVFRIYLLTKSENMLYNLGNIENMQALDNKPVDDIDNLLNIKIPVYRRDGSKVEIEDGATALDFAFMIHKEIGLCAKYAIINNIIPPEEKKLESLSHVIAPGDRVDIVSDSSKDGQQIYHATFEWFNFIQTVRARNYLIRYFKEKFGEGN
ncbi:MAG: HD domain-containing protein [Firmicutes bacterium]|nr:HD domain-containing protein [Bacillota bacterium]